MKILVVFTGGTIGSRAQNGWISPDGDTKYTLIENYISENGNDVEFASAEPYFILSEDLSADELNRLTHCVKENLDKGYDGIIVTHGTDTLQFSAAALSFAVGSDCIPIVLVSANHPLEDPRSNGSANFKGAVEFIKHGCGNGVFISYKNRNDHLKFHGGLDAIGYSEADDCVHSLYNEPYAVYDGKSIEVCGAAEIICPVSPFTLTEHHGILTLCATPGDCFDYDLPKYNAVILRPYHSGTLNTASIDFKRFCQKAKELDIPIFVCNIHPGTTYESAKLFEELGIIPLTHTTYAAVFMRLWIGASRGENLKNLF